MNATLLMMTALLLSGPGQAARPEYLPTGGAYVNALRVVDEFLQAWSHKDSNAGLKLVSQRLLAQPDAVDLRQYIEGLSNPYHCAFEIGAGTEVDSTRFSFPVVFYAYYTGEPEAYRAAGTIEVARESDQWRVDRLPPEGR